MILFGDNPDGYTTANVPIFWDEVFGNYAVRADGYLGRAAFTSTSGAAHLRKYAIQPGIHPIENEFRLGGRFLLEAYPAGDVGLLTVVDDLGDEQVSCVLKTDGTLVIWNGADALVTNTVLSLDTAYRLGFKGSVRITGGYAEIYLNHTRIGRFTGRTSRSDIPNWAGFQIGLPEDCAVNHVYMMDNSGHWPDLLPGFMVKHLTDIADGTFTDFVPNTGSDLFAVVDDDDPDDDATVAQGATVGDKMSFVHSTLADTAVIYSIQPVVVAVALDADSPVALRHIMVIGGGAYAGYPNWVQPLQSGASPTPYRAFREVMPYRTDDGHHFTTYPDGTNVMEFGVEVV